MELKYLSLLKSFLQLRRKTKNQQELYETQSSVNSGLNSIFQQPNVGQDLEEKILSDSISNIENSEYPINIKTFSQTEETDNIIQEEKTSTSLLQNQVFIKLVEECIDIMNEFEMYTERVQFEETKVMTQLVVERLQEALERSGLTRIEIGTGFSILKHIPIPMMPVTEGQPLEEIVSSGLEIDNRVFRKAKVKVKTA